MTRAFAFAIVIGAYTTIGYAQNEMEPDDQRAEAYSALLQRDFAALHASLRTLGLAPNRPSSSFCETWLRASGETRGRITDAATDSLLSIKPEDRAIRDCVKISLRSSRNVNVDLMCRTDPDSSSPTPSDFLALLQLGRNIAADSDICKLAGALREE